MDPSRRTDMLGETSAEEKTPNVSFVDVVHRYYDPTTEQFLSVDPLADVTETPYAFTAGDPVNSIDPTGLMVFSGTEGALTVQKIMADPQVLKGLSPNGVEEDLLGTEG